MIDWYL